MKGTYNTIAYIFFALLIRNNDYVRSIEITGTFGSPQRVNVFGRGLYSGEERSYFRVQYRYSSSRATISYGKN